MRSGLEKKRLSERKELFAKQLEEFDEGTEKEKPLPKEKNGNGTDWYKVISLNST
jgi:hypothetical protein